MPDTPLLDQVHIPADTRGFDIPQLRQLADEVRAETIDAVSVTGGHLGAGLGVVELTVALHHVFETPKDILIWDVGHQCYPHKILTGRRDRIRTLRQPGGLSGFTKRSESEYDPFGAAHSSTSVSSGLGMAVASELQGRKRNVVAVIGDGAMSAGMSYEAMNNAGAMDVDLLVILNDNNMSIILLCERESSRNSISPRQRSRCMRVFNNIVFALSAVWISCNSTTLAQHVESICSTSKNVMNITLMSGIKEDDIFR